MAANCLSQRGKTLDKRTHISRPLNSVTAAEVQVGERLLQHCGGLVVEVCEGGEVGSGILRREIAECLVGKMRDRLHLQPADECG